jgi:hypothetical protein
MAGPVHGLLTTETTTTTSRFGRIVQAMKALGNGGGGSSHGKPQPGRPGTGTDWVRRSLLFLPLTLASYSLLRQYRLVGMVVDDRMSSSSTSRMASVPQPMVRFVAPPASDDKHHHDAHSSSASRLRPELGACAHWHLSVALLSCVSIQTDSRLLDLFQCGWRATPTRGRRTP